MAEDNPNATPSEKAALLRNFVKEVKELIKNNPKTKINDLFKILPGVVPAVQDNVKKDIPNIKPVDKPASNKKDSSSSSGCPIRNGCA